MAAVDRVEALPPLRAVDPVGAVDRVPDPRDVERVAVDRPPRAVEPAAVPDVRVPVARRPEAALDRDADAAETRAVDLGLMSLRINRICHRSPVHLTGHTGGVSVS